MAWSSELANFFQIVLIVVVGPQLCEGQSTENAKSDNLSYRETRYNSQDFSRLKLNVKELFGSRWALVQKTIIEVTHHMEIVDAVLEHEDQLTLRVEFHLRQKWFAEGLEFPEGLFKDSDSPDDYLTAKENVLRDMWSPDSFVSTSRESSHMNIVTAPQSVVLIFRNGTIIFKVRMFVKVGCTTNFQWYPLDVQSCELRIESYKYDDTSVSYTWEDDSLYRPILLKIKRLLQYDLRYDLPKIDNGTITRGGRGVVFPFIRANFTFERRLGNNVIQVYTPTTLVVVLSWVSFWLGLDAVPGRISLLVTCMLTLVTMHSGIKSSIPPVHYVTMMDIWLVGCMTFVFSAICEFVIVKYWHWRHQLKQKAEDRKFQDKNRERFETCISIIQGGLGNNQDKQHFNENGVKNGVTAAPPQIPVMIPQAWGNGTTHTNGLSSKVVPGELLKSFLVGAVATSVFDEMNDGETAVSSERESSARKYGKDGVNEEGDAAGQKHTKMHKWVAMDRICRGFFPFLFCTFNSIYWPLLFEGSSMQQLDM